MPLSADVVRKGEGKPLGIQVDGNEKLWPLWLARRSTSKEPALGDRAWRSVVPAAQARCQKAFVLVTDRAHGS